MLILPVWVETSKEMGTMARKKILICEDSEDSVRVLATGPDVVGGLTTP